MKRRWFTLGIGAAALPLSGMAQQTRRLRRIGYLSIGTLAAAQPFLDVHRAALRQLGWIEGANIESELRAADGKPERIPDLVAELVRAQVETIVVASDPLALAARRTTTSIPIVVWASGDPVGSGLITSLARPGGNVTGLTVMTPELGGKRLQLLSGMVPRLSRVAAIWNNDNRTSAQELAETQQAAKTLGLSLLSAPIQGSKPELDKAFVAMRADRAQALVVLSDPYMFTQRREIAALADANRLPSIWEGGIFLDAGGLMSYGPDIMDNFRQAAKFIDKILKGEKPGDIPVEQPTKFELIINAKTARALGLVISGEMRLRADKIIE